MKDYGKKLSLPERVTYRFAWSVLWALSKILFRFRVIDKKNFPTEGAYILSPVHRSYLDTPVGGMVTARRQRFMGKESLWKNKFSGTLLSLVGAFPVERGTADRAALRACQEILERGEPLVMFPEGTRRHGPIVKKEEMHAGPAFVSLRTGAPIVPMGIAGTDYAWPPGVSKIKPHKVILVVGEPIYPRVFEGRVPRRAVDELTEELRQKLQIVFDQAQEILGKPALPEPSNLGKDG